MMARLLLTYGTVANVAAMDRSDWAIRTSAMNTAHLLLLPDMLSARPNLVRAQGVVWQ